MSWVFFSLTPLDLNHPKTHFPHKTIALPKQSFLKSLVHFITPLTCSFVSNFIFPKKYMVQRNLCNPPPEKLQLP
jgi:hypothetical protein